MTSDSEPAAGSETAEGAAYDTVLIFDGECPFCSAAASALRRLDGAGAIEWNNDAATAFLEAQFGEVPFALAFVDPDAGTVWIGREAARELCERAGLPVLIGDVVGDNYESIADAVRTVAGGERDPDAYHGVFDLSEEAAAEFDSLGANARSTHRPGDRDSGGRLRDRLPGDR